MGIRVSRKIPVFIRFMMLVAGLAGAAAVAMGALHSHGLEELLEQQGFEAGEIQTRMDLCDTANKYLVLHAGAILGCTALIATRGGLVLKLAATGLVLGTVGFCGSLYLLAFTTNETWATTAPVGGITLIVSWLFVALTAFVPHYGREPPDLSDLELV